MPRRRGIAVTTAITLLLVVVGVLRRRFLTELATAARPTAARGPALEAPQLPAREPPVSQRPQTSLAQMAAQDLRQRARYPHSSQPLREGQPDPILRDREVSRNVFPGPNGEEPSLTVYPDQVSFEHPEPIILYAYLTSGDKRVPAKSIEGDVVNARGEHLARIEYNDSALDADREAGDLVYTARVSAAVADNLAGGAYLVRVRAVSADGGQRGGATGFLYSRPSAQLTGRYRDAISGGNLELQAEVEVQEAGRFHIEGTLYAQAGAPLAWAQNAAVLTPGTHWIPLSFFGLILHERGEDGPYVLRFVALSTTTSMPSAKNRLVENAHVTGAYRARDFSDRPYDDPHLLDTAKRLDEGAAAESAPEVAEP